MTNINEISSQNREHDAGDHHVTGPSSPALIIIVVVSLLVVRLAIIIISLSPR